jgi:hypothetical protein
MICYMQQLFRPLDPSPDPFYASRIHEQPISLTVCSVAMTASLHVPHPARQDRNEKGQESLSFSQESPILRISVQMEYAL